MYKGQVPNGEIALLVIWAVSLRAESETTMKSIAKHVAGLVRFYREVRDEAMVELTGEQSVVAIRDYAESLDERAARFLPSRIARYLSGQTPYGSTFRFPMLWSVRMRLSIQMISRNKRLP